MTGFSLLPGGSLAGNWAIVSPATVFFLRQYLLSVMPKAILGAPRIDGASELTIFHCIVLPIMAPGIATMDIGAFIGSWNSCLIPMLLINTPSKRPLPVIVAELSNPGEPEPVSLKWYISFGWYNTPWGSNAVSEAITKKAGVDITFVSPEGSETETLDALIAGNSLSDLVTLGWWESQLNTIIEKGMVYALNEQADEYDPYFWQVTDEAQA